MRHIFFLLLSFFFLSIASGQTSDLFESEEILELTLLYDLKSVHKDRGEDPQYHEAKMHPQRQQEKDTIVRSGLSENGYLILKKSLS